MKHLFIIIIFYSILHALLLLLLLLIFLFFGSIFEYLYAINNYQFFFCVIIFALLKHIMSNEINYFLKFCLKSKKYQKQG
jgi:hypothetical protein